ncbi:DMT family transporter [Shewanella surugensis]|uniref:DMT family transporter n=1 Tax=Shewanella surugensis TaxID=212020 RepID=A0ABT0LBQ9_9GAMM|nr:DMT family transporter [Shewanella surugensis]MCL1125098.1 DMT family transporter [Shewanella surugensis]
MLRQVSDRLLAIVAGSLLALMISINSGLAILNSPLQASWAAHGIGALVAIFLVVVYSRCFRLSQSKANRHKKDNKLISLPSWAYFGGIPGAFTVLLAAITVNSEIGLSGTLACALVGQIVFGMISDHFGWFESEIKAFVLQDLLKVLPIIAGSFLLIFI